MDGEHRAAFDHLQDLADDDDFDASHPGNFVNMEGVLDGSERIEIRHAGGEFGPHSLEQDIEEDTDDEDAGAKKK